MRHSNDLTSVCAWVEELKLLPNNPLLLFKAQGEPQPDDMDNVGIDDFILGIQTQFQREMLCKYGDVCICMDATHGTKMYDFKLITILVLDDFGEGLPVAWTISNMQGRCCNVGRISGSNNYRIGALKPPRWVMSDDAEHYNSWKSVFGVEGTSKLLCAWDIDRFWRNTPKEYVHTTQAHLEGCYSWKMKSLLLELSYNSSFTLTMKRRTSMPISRLVTALVWSSGNHAFLSAQLSLPTCFWSPFIEY